MLKPRKPEVPNDRSEGADAPDTLPPKQRAEPRQLVVPKYDKLPMSAWQIAGVVGIVSLAALTGPGIYFGGKFAFDTLFDEEAAHLTDYDAAYQAALDGEGTSCRLQAVTIDNPKQQLAVDFHINHPDFSTDFNNAYHRGPAASLPPRYIVQPTIDNTPTANGVHIAIQGVANMHDAQTATPQQATEYRWLLPEAALASDMPTTGGSQHLHFQVALDTVRIDGAGKPQDVYQNVHGAGSRPAEAFVPCSGTLNFKPD